ncbi:Hypothetical predicted protein [Olea europaea subsp. europaea]|uniref:THO1-MOS11 C-terminal domain-containing protein n=1 Tax=Olea europaea subsp. europaea TaxID=158383 RepID=A0A8S0UTJ5_OLEEU|nr:Hypothetical predicted protein [Olea europaea subsp. europaea]
MATATVPKVENPKNAVTQTAAPNSTPSTTEDPHCSAAPIASPTHGGSGDDKPREENPKTGAAAKNTDSSTEGAVTDIQKKLKRAERFGMPVQLSEQEKRNTRAERFGIGSTTQGSESSKQPEELKRKARAERFGIVQSTPVDEEARKKARLARFGSVAKVDSTEDDKKKARAIRFSHPHSGPLSGANDNGNTEFVSYCKPLILGSR